MGPMMLQGDGCNTPPRFRSLTVAALITATTLAAGELDVNKSVTELFTRIHKLLAGWQSLETPAKVQISENLNATTFVLIQKARWELKGQPQSGDLERKMWREAMNLPESERLKQMNRIENHVQVWLVPVKEPLLDSGELRKKLAVTGKPHEQHRELAYLGKSEGVACFCYMPIYEWIRIQKELGFQGGDEPISAIVRGLTIKDNGYCTRNTSVSMIAEAGPDALAVIYAAIAEGRPDAAAAAGALGTRQDGEAVPKLIEYASSANAEVAVAARGALLQNPQPQAEHLCVQWLEEKAGKTEVGQELAACYKLKAKAARSALNLILQSPQSTREYREAFMFARELDGNSVAQELIEAEQAIWKHGYRSGPDYDDKKVNDAVETIVKSADTAAAAMIGILLATAGGKGDYRFIRLAGLDILGRLPDARGRKLAELMARTVTASWEVKKVQDVARELSGE